MDISSVALQGLHRAEASFNRSAVQISRIEPPGRQESQQAPTDRVELSTEAVNLLSAKNDYEANLKSVEVGDQLTKSVLALWPDGSTPKH